MQEKRQVRRDLAMELGNILVRVSVIVGPIKRATVFPNEVVFWMRMDHVDLVGFSLTG